MADSTESAQPGHVPGVAERRDLRLLWTGSTASQLGNMASTVTAPLLALTLTSSPVFAGWVAAAGTLPRILLHLPAGVLADYSDRRRVMVGSMLVRAALAVLMVGCLIVSEDGGIVYLLPLVSIAQGICVVLYSTAETTAVPWLVRRERLARAMAGNEARTHVAGLLGRPLGGWLFELGRCWPFVLDVATSVVSALTLLRMRNKRFARAAVRRPLRPARQLRAFRRGLTFLRHEEFLARVMIVCALANFAFQTLGLTLVLLAHEREMSPLMIGLLIAASGLGGVLGSLTAPRMLRRMKPARLIVAGVWAWLLLSACLTVTDHGSFLYVAAVLPAAWGGIGFIGAHINVALALYQTSGVPKRLFGRVTSVIRFFSGSTVPLGALAGGYLLALLGTERAVVLVAFVVGGLALAISAPRRPSAVRRRLRRERPGDRARQGAGNSPATSWKRSSLSAWRLLCRLACIAAGASAGTEVDHAWRYASSTARVSDSILWWTRGGHSGRSQATATLAARYSTRTWRSCSGRSSPPRRARLLPRMSREMRTASPSFSTAACASANAASSSLTSASRRSASRSSAAAARSCLALFRSLIT
ncbi:MFS transporter [Nonomuraea thailandensis]